MLRTALRSAARPALRAQPVALPRPALLLRTVVSTSTSRTRSPAVLQPLIRASPAAKRYTPEHEWVEYDDATGLGTIGITEYAQAKLGDVVYVELPAEGTQIAAGGALYPDARFPAAGAHSPASTEEIGAVESVKAASDIFAPVAGQVVEINGKLEDSPDLLNKSAEGEGASSSSSSFLGFPLVCLASC